MSNAERVKRAIDLAAAIDIILEGNEEAVQGAALAQTLAAFLGREPAEMRQDLLELHIRGVRSMMLDPEDKSDD